MKPWVIVVCLVNLIIQLLMWRRLRQYAKRAREGNYHKNRDIVSRKGVDEMSELHIWNDENLCGVQEETMFAEGIYIRATTEHSQKDAPYCIAYCRDATTPKQEQALLELVRIRVRQAKERMGG